MTAPAMPEEEDDMAGSTSTWNPERIDPRLGDSEPCPAPSETRSLEQIAFEQGVVYIPVTIELLERGLIGPKWSSPVQIRIVDHPSRDPRLRSLEVKQEA